MGFSSDWSEFLDSNTTRRQPPPPAANGQTRHPEPDSAYVQAALRDELAALAAMAPKTGRNTALYEAAKSLGRLPIDRGQLRGQLLDACRTNGVYDEDGPAICNNSIDSGFKKADLKGPRTIPENRNKINGHVIEVNSADINGGAEDGRKIRWETAAQIQDAVPVWAWRHNGHGRIQLGTLALFAGRPGAGKSTAARWFAAQVTRGLLEGCWKDHPQHVAYIATAEESTRYTITPGLRAAGADLNRIHFPTVHRDGQTVQLLSTLDEAALTEYLLAHSITVVIVDPLMSTITATTDINKNNETRAQIQPWARIADAINGIVIGVAHLRKNSTGDVVAAVTGSSAFGEVARAIFGFAKNMADDTRVMSQHKNSTGYEDLSLTYRIESEAVTVATGDTADVGKFVITGNSEMTVEDILSDSTMAGGANLECLRWLEDYLTQQGSVPSKEAKAEAHKEIGASISSVDRAAKKLRVVVDSRGFPRRTYWSLPPTVTSPDPGQSRHKSRHE